jgi:hypothetical protein
MTNPTPVPLGPTGDAHARPAENELRAVDVNAAIRLWHRVGITANVQAYRPTDDRDDLIGSLRVNVTQRAAGGLAIVVDDPDAADDLAAALTWAATRLRDLLTHGEPATDRRTFGLAEPGHTTSTGQGPTPIPGGDADSTEPVPTSPAVPSAWVLPALSGWIDAHNAHRPSGEQLWCRVGKIGEEYGEAVNALIGMTGQNPRKGITATRDHLRAELLDVAVTALAAVEHLNANTGTALAALDDHLRHLAARADLHPTTATKEAA